MAKPYLEVDQPEPHSIAHAAEYTVGTTKYWFLTASGLQLHIPRLVACLIDLDAAASTPAVYPGTVLSMATEWVIGFSGLPPQKKTYLLLVAEAGTADAKSRDPAVAVEFTADGPHGAKKSKSKKSKIKTAGSIPIQYPGSNSMVCPSFSAYGSNGPNGTPTSASMQQDGQQAIAGTALPGVPNGIWVFQFSNLPDSPLGTSYTLSVLGPGGDSGQSTGLVVSSLSCNPVVGG
jgi:hypothetical protein